MQSDATVDHAGGFRRAFQGVTIRAKAIAPLHPNGPFNKAEMGVKNYLIEGGSGTGKTTIAEEL